MTFEEFKVEVEKWWAEAPTQGHFQDHAPDRNDREFYTWKGSCGGVVQYDSLEEPFPWASDNSGYGVPGWGRTLPLAEISDRDRL